jgi:peptidoglycan/LPS O-acetylase OafA/YrhL
MSDESSHGGAPPGRPHDGRIPCLDGLRAISILGVFCSHLEGTRNFPLHPERIADLGNFGVRVFFVISGYLITRLLIGEHDKTGTISLPMFYFRRTFRIFPAFYGLIALFTVAGMLGWVKIADGDVLHAMTFTMNYHYVRAWQVGHLWSLAVEEQFYLLWPAIVLLLRPKRAVWVAALAIVLAPLVRVATWELLPAQRVGIGESFQTVADTLAMGCLLALLSPRLGRVRWFVRMQKHPLTPIAMFSFALLVAHFHGYISVSFTVGETLMSLAFALLVDSLIRNPTSFVGRFLELRPIAYVGVLSYSLYLVQQPLLDRESTAWFNAFPANVLLTIVFALASYYLVEKPFLDFRVRIAKRWKRPPPRITPSAIGDAGTEPSASR